MAALEHGFGAPPDGTCPEALLAQRFAAGFIVIARFNWPLMHLLVLGRRLYDELHDPFAIAECYTPDWTARGSLPELAWPPAPLPARTVALLDSVLKHGDGPFLLGAALVDRRPHCPATARSRNQDDSRLVGMLPDAVRRTIWPATFAFGADGGFDLLVLPEIVAAGLPGYLSEEQRTTTPTANMNVACRLPWNRAIRRRSIGC